MKTHDIISISLYHIISHRIVSYHIRSYLGNQFGSPKHGIVWWGKWNLKHDLKPLDFTSTPFLDKHSDKPKNWKLEFWNVLNPFCFFWLSHVGCLSNYVKCKKCPLKRQDTLSWNKCLYQLLRFWPGHQTTIIRTTANKWTSSCGKKNM
jgi:hypothetical protein